MAFSALSDLTMYVNCSLELFVEVSEEFVRPEGGLWLSNGSLNTTVTRQEERFIELKG